MANNYSSKDINTLEGREHIRKYPGNYIGSKDIDGLHHCLKEILSNSVDEYLNANCDTIEVTMHLDGGISISDNGRGIPIGKHKSGDCSTLEACFTILNTGGKFDNETGESGYNTSGGEHGIGAKAVNALSKRMVVCTRREGKYQMIEFKKGVKVKEEFWEEAQKESGMYVYFLPDDTIFDTITFDKERIKTLLREFSFLNKNLKFIYVDNVLNENQEYYSEKGLRDYLDYLNKGNLVTEPIYFKSKEGKYALEAVLGYNDTFSSNIKLYTNSIPQESGTHLTGFKTALTSCINNYAREKKLLKEKDENFTGSDLEEGQILILNFNMIDPVFQGQAKEVLKSSEGRTMVQKFAQEELMTWLNGNPSKAKIIINKALVAKKARDKAKKAKEAVRSVEVKKSKRIFMPDKLSDANEKNRAKCELFLVEGDSAAGTAKSARDRNTQAILSLRGKVLNTSKVDLAKALSNEEIKSILVALGIEFSSSGKLIVNPDKLRYGKLVFLTDADVDGGHIRTLLLTMLWNLVPEVFELGIVYSAVPPLYRILKTNSSIYLLDDAALIEYQEKHPGEKYDLSRFKGLGEMSADQLWESTMNPKTRVLKQMTIKDAQEAEKVFNELMGKSVEKRKKFIEENAEYAVLDV